MTTPRHPQIIPPDPPPSNSLPPDNDHLVVRWGSNGNIAASVTNWIPPDETCPPHADTGPKKKLSKGLQHVKEILGEYDTRTATVPNDPSPSDQPSEPFDLDGPRKSPPEYLQQRAQPSFEFDGLIWTKTKIELSEQHHPEDPMAPTSMPTTRWKAMAQASEYAPGDSPMKPKSTTEWHQKTPAPGQLSSASMTDKPTTKWQTKTPASSLGAAISLDGL